jgi:hypothetical protein
MEVVVDPSVRHEPLLPSERAFVLQLYADATVEADRFMGRVEHVVSGQATHFHTVAELLAFIARVLDEQHGRPAAEP